jgi:hypothetical protein
MTQFHRTKVSNFWILSFVAYCWIVVVLITLIIYFLFVFGLMLCSLNIRRTIFGSLPLEVLYKIPSTTHTLFFLALCTVVSSLFLNTCNL